MSNFKKFFFVCVIALILFLVINQPAHAADVVHSILLWLQSCAISIMNFIEGVFHG